MLHLSSKRKSIACILNMIVIDVKQNVGFFIDHNLPMSQDLKKKKNEPKQYGTLLAKASRSRINKPLQGLALAHHHQARVLGSLLIGQCIRHLSGATFHPLSLTCLRPLPMYASPAWAVAASSVWALAIFTVAALAFFPCCY